MNNKKIQLQDDAVISLNNKSDQFIIQHITFKVEELLARLKSALGSSGTWFDDGVDCEVLHPGGLWQEGKVRIRIEFCPNESESIDSIIPSDNSDSELDDIRQILSQDK